MRRFTRTIIAAATLAAAALAPAAHAQRVYDPATPVYDNVGTLSPASPSFAAMSSAFSGQALKLLGSSTRAVPSFRLAPVVNQGDRVYVVGTMCTIGYIDHATHRAYLAKHCARVDTVNVRTSDGKYPGTFVRPDAPGDTAWIELDPRVRAGANRFTGDTVIDRHAVKSGDTICFYGATSRETRCAAVKSTGTDHDPFIIGNPMQILAGDSGGPAWIVGKGAVGVVAAVTVNPNNNQVLTTRFSALTPHAAAR